MTKNTASVNFKPLSIIGNFKLKRQKVKDKKQITSYLDTTWVRVKQCRYSPLISV
jgi:hypothetical protein